MYANIQIPSNLALDPFLAGLVVKLALDMPAFTFSTKGMSKQDLNYATSPSALQDREAKPPEGTQFLREVRVYAGAESLGSLAIDRRYKSRGGGDDVYCVKSWRIDNQRGNANTSSTSKLGGAVRIVKKTFIPMNVAEIVGKASSDLHHAYVGALRDLSRPIEHSNMTPSTTVMQRYVYLLLRKEEIPDGVDKAVRDAMLSERYEKAMLEYMLAAKMRDKQMAIVVQHNNLFLHRRVTPDVIEQNTFDELPLAVQNAVAVLQLMEDGELVDDIGFRFNDRNFLIVNALFDIQE
jgi:hypothetical protein